MRRQKKDLRDAHMIKYEKFAWQDALSLAALLEESYDLEEVRRGYESLSVKELDKYEQANVDIIQELIAKPVSQRPAYLRRVCKEVSEFSQAVIIVLSIVAQVRAKEVIELRDRFRYSLYPGGGNRVTCAGIYAFSNAMMSVHFMGWPTAVFEALSVSKNESAHLAPLYEEWASLLQSYDKDD